MIPAQGFAMTGRKHAASEARLDQGLAPLYQEIVRAFRFFNAKHWDSKLSVPVFSFFPQPPNGHRLGHYCPKAWAEEGTRVRKPEIIFFADLCLKSGIEQVLETLLHEMTHHWQAEFGGPPKTKTSSFHDNAWHAEAQRVGLVTDGCNCDKKPCRKGHSSAGPGFLAALLEFKPRVESVPFRSVRTPTKGKMRKWICGCKGRTLRAGAKELTLYCTSCKQDVREA